MKEYGEGNGHVHLMSQLNSHRSLCDLAFDYYSGEEYHDYVEQSKGTSDEIVRTDKTIVTCPECITEINNCIGVKFKGEE